MVTDGGVEITFAMPAGGSLVTGLFMAMVWTKTHGQIQTLDISYPRDPQGRCVMLQRKAGTGDSPYERSQLDAEQIKKVWRQIGEAVDALYPPSPTLAELGVKKFSETIRFRDLSIDDLKQRRRAEAAA